MKGSEWLAIGSALLISVGIGVRMLVTVSREQSYTPKGDRPLYPSRHSRVVACCILVLSILLVLLFHPSNAHVWLQIYGAATLILGLYYGVLLLLRPIYRRKLRAESCAYLWVLIWILLIAEYWLFKLSIKPRWFLSFPFRFPGENILRWMTGVWLAGFVGVMLWSFLSHICYRRWLLKDADPVKEGLIKECYNTKRRMINFPAEYASLWVSRKIKTPVSIGLFWKTTCIVLPEKPYMEEELELIFHHELVHICRRDSLTKLQMTLSVAAMWFNPLVWMAMRACANDLEQSCDEAVLYGCPAEKRKRYAQLLLQTAACARGFTTCLSSSAKALRYRLRSVVNPGRTVVGSILTGVLCFVLMLNLMYLGIRFQPEQANHLIFNNEDLSSYDVGEIISIAQSDTSSGGECVRDQELLAYIGDLSLRWSSGPYDVYQEDHIQITVRSESKTYIFAFGEKHLQVLTITYANNKVNNTITEYYELAGELDWNFIRSCAGRGSV